jgi:hypothetical protein
LAGEGNIPVCLSQKTVFATRSRRKLKTLTGISNIKYQIKLQGNYYRYRYRIEQLRYRYLKVESIKVVDLLESKDSGESEQQIKGKDEDVVRQHHGAQEFFPEQIN